MAQEHSQKKTEIIQTMASVLPVEDGRSYFKFEVSGYVSSTKIGLALQCLQSFVGFLEMVQWIGTGNVGKKI